jgi:hypothetical protein
MFCRYPGAPTSPASKEKSVPSILTSSIIIRCPGNAPASRGGIRSDSSGQWHHGSLDLGPFSAAIFGLPFRSLSTIVCFVPGGGGSQGSAGPLPAWRGGDVNWCGSASVQDKETHDEASSAFACGNEIRKANPSPTCQAECLRAKCGSKHWDLI